MNAKMISSLLLAVATVTSTSTALALDCSGIVKGLRVTNEGMVEAKFNGDGDGTYANFCSLKNTWSEGGNTVDPVVCEAWLKVLTSAYLSGRTASFYGVSTTTCTVNGGTMIPDRLGVR